MRNRAFAIAIGALLATTLQASAQNFPSRPLTITTLLIVAIGMALPFTPLAGTLGFTPLPGLYFLFLAGMTITYLLLVEVVKRRLMRGLIH